MKSTLQNYLFLAFFISLFSLHSQTENKLMFEQKPLKIGNEFTINFSTPHPYTSNKASLVLEKEFYSKNAGYIKLYFKNFNLAPGDYVEIYSPVTRESIFYASKGKIVDENKTMISNFWSKIMFSDKIIVKLHAVQASKGYGFDIEKVAYGYTSEKILRINKQQSTICGRDDKQKIECVNGTEMYEKAKAVCQIIVGGGGACTGWLIGCEGNIITNNHCISSASKARDADFVFNYQTTDCAGTSNALKDVVATSATLIKTNTSTDATLLKLPVNPTDKYGYLSFRSEAAKVNDRIYIPQHAGARRKEIAAKNEGGIATINSTAGFGDFNYFADTEGGSSGSPVIDFNSNLVLGLHSNGGCPNSSKGGNTRLIAWLGADMPPCGLDDDNTGNKLPVSKFDISVNCNIVTLSSAPSNYETEYLWDFGDGKTSTEANPTHAYSTSDNFTVTLKVSNSIGTDSSEKTITSSKVDIPNNINKTLCEGESTSVELTGNGDFIWYDKPTEGNIIATGKSFDTGVLNTNKSYYVSATPKQINNGEVGLENINPSNGDNHNGGYYLVFDASEDFILKKAKVFANGAGERTLELRDSSENLLQTKVINIPNGESVIDINMKIDAGVDMQIGFSNGANLFRNNSNINFPYTFETGGLTIKKSTAASDPLGFYYYLYNWQIAIIGNCETQDRAKINIDLKQAYTPTIIVDYNTGKMTVSQTYPGYQWYLNGNVIDGATSKSYKATENGTYMVKNSNNSCSKGSVKINIEALSINYFELPKNITIYPNPAKDVLNIKGLNTLNHVKHLKIINIFGQTIKKHPLKNTLKTITINIDTLAKGVYFLNIDNKYTTKIIIE